jgi:hypothetical protein
MLDMHKEFEEKGINDAWNFIKIKNRTYSLGEDKKGEYILCLICNHKCHCKSHIQDNYCVRCEEYHTGLMFDFLAGRVKPARGELI